MEKFYLHAAGVTSPLGVIFGLIQLPEKGIDQFTIDFLIQTFVEFTCPEMEKCLAVLPQTKGLDKKILGQIGQRISDSHNVIVASTDYCQMTPYIRAVGGSIMFVEVDITELAPGKLEELKSTLDRDRQRFLENTGLRWLQVDSDNLTGDKIKRLRDQIIAGKSVNLEECEKPTPAKAEENPVVRENKLRLWLRLSLGLADREFSLKCRNKKRGLLYHLWICPRALTRLNLDALGLSSQSGYRPLEEIYDLVEATAVKKTEKQTRRRQKSRIKS